MPVPDLVEMSSPLTTVANFLSGGLWSRCVGESVFPWHKCIYLFLFYFIYYFIIYFILCNFGGTLLSVCHRFFQALVR